MKSAVGHFEVDRYYSDRKEMPGLVFPSSV
jgi:hypothetical protein